MGRERVPLKVGVPKEWKEALEEIRREKLYGMLSELLKSILREYLLTEYYKGKAEPRTTSNTSHYYWAEVTVRRTLVPCPDSH